MNKGYKTIPIRVITRWNSEIRTLKSILAISLDDLNGFIDECKFADLCLTKNDRLLISKIVRVLEPFEYVSDLLQG